jgi:hypothetical protein
MGGANARIFSRAQRLMDTFVPIAALNLLAPPIDRATSVMARLVNKSSSRFLQFHYATHNS